MSFGERKLNERVICADGFSMSVQASEYTYCTPRDSIGPYTAVEIGMPTTREDDFMPYCEDPEDPTGTVYGYVPASIVSRVISRHGGIISGRVPVGVFQFKSEYSL